MLNNAEKFITNMISDNDLKLLAQDCFDSLTLERSINQSLVGKLKGDVSNYLATGNSVHVNKETRRLIDALILYTIYQLETRVQSVSKDVYSSTSPPDNL